MFVVDKSKIFKIDKDVLRYLSLENGLDGCDLDKVDVNDDMRRALDTVTYKDDEFVNLVYQDERLYLAKEMPDESRESYADNFYCSSVDSVQKYRFLEEIDEVDVLRLRVKQASYVVDCKIARKDLYDCPMFFYQLERVKTGIINLHMIGYNSEEVFRTYRMIETLHCFDGKEIHRC